MLGLLLFTEYKDGGLTFKTECDVCRELYIRLFNHAAESENAVSADIIRSRGRSPQYILTSDSRESIASVKERLGVPDLTLESLFIGANKLSEKNFGAFAAGVFLACGSVSSPDKEYHLEFVLPSDKLSYGLSELLSLRIGVAAKCTERKGASVLYLKDSESIEDILTLIGATMSSLEIMNVKVLKDIRNRANRATNCDTANCERQNRSAAKQLEAIKKIESSEGGLSQLSDELRSIAEMRIKYPEYTLAELSQEFEPPISKSGANHRLAKLIKIAEEL